jgi:hypothetical protein
MIEKADEEFRDLKILLSFAIGNISNMARLVNKKDSKYITCFPIQKIYAKADRETTNPTKTDYVMYNELFAASKDIRMLKLNLVSSVPKEIFEIVKHDNKVIIDTFFNDKNTVVFNGKPTFKKNGTRTHQKKQKQQQQQKQKKQKRKTSTKKTSTKKSMRKTSTKKTSTKINKF